MSLLLNDTFNNILLLLSEDKKLKIIINIIYIHLIINNHYSI